ncbi:MAG: Stp1/IreP family PP2C-type Ser/Thr phosphatase [Deltaproteobacteria bacterium]|nr:Stp1/IreP family PP2C-type Ser/Thr phosphatase [Deltaproteobacteria bacterium]
MKILSGYVTDVGRKRKLNEDSYVVNDSIGLYAVADGMGGHSCGEVASKTATDMLGSMMEVSHKKGTLAKDPLNALTEAIKVANTAVYEMSRKLGPGRSMGTTIAAVAGVNGKIFAAHVGDSRIYKMSSGKIEQIMRDHSLVEEQVARGLITAEQAKTATNKNVITRALGLKEPVEIDTAKIDVAPGDYVLICSDGLNGLVGDDEILKISTADPSLSPEMAAMYLVEKANNNGGDDNITVVLLKFVK